MTRDYAKRSRSRAQPARTGGKGNGRKRQPAAPAGPSTWQWLIVVAVTSAFVGFVVYLNTLPPEAPAPASHEVPSVAPEKSRPVPPSAETRPREPEYRFYEMLPESEVVAPEVEAYNPGRGERQKFEYILQTGSFRTLADAQRQKAQIGFQGLRADVSQVDLDSGDTWFRVQVGPYESRSTMNSVIDRLVSINIQPLVRKRPLENSP